MSFRVTRKGLFAAGAGGAGAAVVGGAIADWPGVARSAPSAQQDVRVLTFVLGLERIEAAFYAEAQRAGALRGELLEFVEVVGDHERQHVAFLEQALSAQAAPVTLEAAEKVKDERRFAATASVLEDAIVSAYIGQATNLTPERLAQAATIASVEARHAAWIRDIVGEPPADDPTDVSRTADQVRSILRREGLLP